MPMATITGVTREKMSALEAGNRPFRALRMGDTCFGPTPSSAIGKNFAGEGINRVANPSLEKEGDQVDAEKYPRPTQ